MNTIYHRGPHFLALAGLGLLVLLSSCGEDDPTYYFDGNGGTGGTGQNGSGSEGTGSGDVGEVSLDTGVDEELLLVDLDASQQQEICDAYVEAYPSFREFNCASVAYLEMILLPEWDAAACSDSYQACLSEFDEAPPCDWSTLVPECERTVADYERCTEPVLEASARLAGSFDCEEGASSFPLAELGAVGDDCTELTECFAVSEP